LVNIKHLSLGIPKRFEEFIFFKIQNPREFKSDLKQLIPCITTTSQIQALRREIEGAKHAGNNKLLKVVGTQISFTSTGLEKVGPLLIARPPEHDGWQDYRLTWFLSSFSFNVKLGIPNDIKDPAFLAGQLASAKDILEDPGVEVDGKFVPKWLPAFKDGVDGLISVRYLSHPIVYRRGLLSHYSFRLQAIAKPR
jgi:hypothetical protein